jgi:hypothetical protein
MVSRLPRSLRDPATLTVAAPGNKEKGLVGPRELMSVALFGGEFGGSVEFGQGSCARSRAGPTWSIFRRRHGLSSLPWQHQLAGRSRWRRPDGARQDQARLHQLDPRPRQKHQAGLQVRRPRPNKQARIQGVEAAPERKMQPGRWAARNEARMGRVALPQTAQAVQVCGSCALEDPDLACCLTRDPIPVC